MLKRYILETRLNTKNETLLEKSYTRNVSTAYLKKLGYEFNDETRLWSKVNDDLIFVLIPAYIQRSKK